MTLRQILARSLLLFLVWRGMLLVALFIGLNLSTEYGGSYAHDSEWNYLPGHYFWNGFFRWDARWYELIAREGYPADGPDKFAVAFFPLFPVMARLLGVVLGSHLVAGLVIAHLSLLVAIVYIYRIGLMFLEQAVVERALVFLLCFPGAFFFSAFYSDSLYLALTAAFLFYFLSRRFLACAVAGAIASFGRPTTGGLMLAAGATLLLESIRHRRWPELSAAWLLLIPAGLVAYMGYLHLVFGDAFAFINAQAHWGRRTTAPPVLILDTLRAIDWRFPRNMINMQVFVNVVTAVGFSCVGFAMLLRRQVFGWPLLGLYVVIGTLLPLTLGSTDSVVRYFAVLFPVFFFLAEKIRSPMATAAVVSFLSMCSVVYGLGFMNKFWVV